MAICLFILDN